MAMSRGKPRDVVLRAFRKITYYSANLPFSYHFGNRRRKPFMPIGLSSILHSWWDHWLKKRALRRTK